MLKQDTIASGKTWDPKVSLYTKEKIYDFISHDYLYTWVIIV